jgi:hypothetical protein
MTTDVIELPVLEMVPQLEALANEYGLVRMRFLVDHTPYYSGSMAGFPPDRAAEYLVVGIAAPCDQNGKPIVIGFAEAAAPSPVVRPSVDIPERWQDLHHLVRVRMAKELLSTERSLTKNEADEIIRTEVERRERTGHG